MRRLRVERVHFPTRSGGGGGAGAAGAVTTAKAVLALAMFRFCFLIFFALANPRLLRGGPLSAPFERVYSIKAVLRLLKS